MAHVDEEHAQELLVEESKPAAPKPLRWHVLGGLGVAAAVASIGGVGVLAAQSQAQHVGHTPVAGNALSSAGGHGLVKLFAAPNSNMRVKSAKART